MPTKDFADRRAPITEGELYEERGRAVAMYAAHGCHVKFFTCDDCAARFTCGRVFDAYNTGGDCASETGAVDQK